jgi:hypothetical protein
MSSEEIGTQLAEADAADNLTPASDGDAFLDPIDGIDDIGDGLDEPERNPFTDEEEAEPTAEPDPSEPEPSPEGKSDDDPELVDAMMEAAVGYGLSLAQARQLYEAGTLDTTLSLLHQQYQYLVPDEQTDAAQPAMPEELTGLSEEELAGLEELDPQLAAVIAKMDRQQKALMNQSRQAQEAAMQQQQAALMAEVDRTLDGLAEYADLLGGNGSLTAVQRMNRARVLDAMGDIQARARARGQALALPELARRAVLVEHGDRIQQSGEQKLAARMQQGKRLASRRPASTGRTDNDKPVSQKEWEEQFKEGWRARGGR